MGYSIILTPEARDHLDAIYDHIAAAASPDIAQRFTDGILDHIGKLTDFPRRGNDARRSAARPANDGLAAVGARRLQARLSCED